ncbi:MAG TPA: hypothetical protein VGN13_02995 [Solirubrobacteraceae bacterium]|jgi:hypothetical protein
MTLSSDPNLNPSRPINVTMVLADHAQVADSKLFVAGGGWTDITGAAPFALAMVIEVPIEQTGMKHKFEVDLIDAHGQPALMPTPQGMTPVHHEMEMEIERPDDDSVPSTFVNPFVIKSGPMPVAPADYEWRLSVDGEAREHWRLPFRVHPAPQQT